MGLGKHKWFFINIVCIVIFFIAVFFVFTSWINTYTLHGESIEVPNYANLDFDAAQILANRDGLKIKISDTLCVDYAQPGVIVDHYPTAGSKVKKGRTIYLSINSTTPVMVVMPKITDVSLRQATQILENKGLKIGNIEYKPDFANNYVFEQRFNSKQIEPGTKIPKGSSIDLLVGKGGDDVLIDIPSLVGLSWNTLNDSLISRGLNVNPIFTPEVQTMADTLKAKIQRQSPAYIEGGKMTASETIDVWLGLDPIYEAISDDLEIE